MMISIYFLFVLIFISLLSCNGQSFNEDNCDICELQSNETFGFGTDNELCRCGIANTLCTCGPCWGTSKPFRRFGRVDGVCTLGVDCELCLSSTDTLQPQPSIPPSPSSPSSNINDKSIKSNKNSDNSGGLEIWQIILLIICTILVLIPFVFCIRIITMKFSYENNIDDPYDNETFNFQKKNEKDINNPSPYIITKNNNGKKISPQIINENNSKDSSYSAYLSPIISEDDNHTPIDVRYSEHTIDSDSTNSSESNYSSDSNIFNDRTSMEL